MVRWNPMLWRKGTPGVGQYRRSIGEKSVLRTRRGHGGTILVYWAVRASEGTVA